MTKRECLIMTAITGVSCVKNFGDFHKFVEDELDGPVHTLEMASDNFRKRLKEKFMPEFNEIMEKTWGGKV